MQNRRRDSALILEKKSQSRCRLLVLKIVTALIIEREHLLK